MTQEAMAADPRIRRRPRAFVFTQICALVLAMYVGWHSYQMVDADRLDIDRALLWMAAAFVMIAYFAWDGSRPKIASWPGWVVGYIRAHPIELLILAIIFAIGVFVRLYRYGDLPPSGYIYLEEHITGGVGWEILQGDRRFAYPLVMYSGALGQWLFGPSTFGLRSMTIAANIALIIPFYLIMREVVQRPAALFSTAMFASLRVFQDTASQASPGALATVVMVWTLLRGFRTGNAIWFIPMAVCVADLFYEYETFKAAPFLAFPFVVFVAVRALLWPLPANLRDCWERTRALAPRAIKPIVVTTVVVLVGIGPMIAQTHRGQHIFFSSLERQKADRTDRGTPGLFSPDAAEQLKWSIQAFTPFVEPEYSVLGPVAARDVIDKITSALLWISLLVALLTFWRGSRVLFLSWFVGGIVAASLLLSNFATWKIAGFLLPGVVLIGFFADDLFLLARRRGSLRMVQALTAACCIIVAGVLAFNLRALNANANDPQVVKEWGNTQSQLYAICDHLRERPADNFAYVSQRVRDWWGFSRPPGDMEERRAAWSDWKFVCWDLQGEAIGSLQEAWPLFRDVEGPVSLTTITYDEELPGIVDTLKRTMPDIGEPDRLTTAPGALFKLLSYATTSSQLNARRGLALSHIAADGSPSGASAVAGGPAFALPHQAGAEAFTLSGIVYVSKAMEASLVPEIVAGLPTVVITVDGKPSFDAVAAPGVESSQALLQGWHLVQIRGYAPADAALRFRWHASDGSNVEPGQNDFYAVEDLMAWRHTRTFAGATAGQAVRFDFLPHRMNHDGLRIDATHLLPLGTRVNRDQWDARWTVPAAGKYTLTVEASGQKVGITIDGMELTALPPVGTNATFEADLSAGDHAIELVFTEPLPRLIGGRLTITDSSGAPVIMEVHPF